MGVEYNHPQEIEERLSKYDRRLVDVFFIPTTTFTESYLNTIYLHLRCNVSVGKKPVTFGRSLPDKTER